MLDDVDERIGPHHGGHIQFDHLAGGVSPGVHDTGPRMRGFEATQHVALRVTIEMHARGGELPHTVGALAGQYLHGTGLAQTMPRGHRAAERPATPAPTTTISALLIVLLPQYC